MAAKKKRKSIFGKLILSTLMALPALINAVKNFTALIESDARLAGRSLLTIVLLSFICLALILTSWFCLSGILFFYLVSLQLSNIIALSLILIMNLLLFVIACLLMISTKNKLYFPRVRRLLSGPNE